MFRNDKVIKRVMVLINRDINPLRRVHLVQVVCEKGGRESEKEKRSKPFFLLTFKATLNFFKPRRKPFGVGHSQSRVLFPIFPYCASLYVRHTCL